MKVVSVFDLISDQSRKQWYMIRKQNIFSLNRNRKVSEGENLNNANNNNGKNNLIPNNINKDNVSNNYTAPLQPFEDIQLDNSKKPLLLARLLSWMLKRIVIDKTQDVRGLHLNVLASSNRNMMRGQLDTIEMKFDKIAYQNFFVSGGGRLIIKGRE